jgi:hypothetical protein
VILRVHLAGAPQYLVGDEVWHGSLAAAIRAEAELIVEYQPADPAGQPHRDALRDQIVDEMTCALTPPGDRYRAPDGVLYSLEEEPLHDLSPDRGRVNSVTPTGQGPTVAEVLRFENLPVGSAGSRRAVVRWSDVTEGIALTWYADEVLVCEGDLKGKTEDQLRSLHFRRDRDWLQS